MYELIEFLLFYKCFQINIIIVVIVPDETATKQILGLNFGTFWSLVLGLFLICCVCVVGVIICVFRKEAQQRQLETEAHLGTPHSVVVGQSPYPSKTEFPNFFSKKLLFYQYFALLNLCFICIKF